MPLYFFDTRDEDDFVTDDEGQELPDIQAAKALAAKSLAELAVDVLPGVSRRCLGVVVRDHAGEAVLTTEMTFEARLLKAAA